MTQIVGVMSKICIDCPHSITGEAVLSEGEMDELEALAEKKERHACHNHPKPVMSWTNHRVLRGDRIAPWFLEI